MHSVVASPCERFPALCQSSGHVSPVVSHWNCPSSSTWLLLPSSWKPDVMLLRSIAIRGDLSAVEWIHPLTQLQASRSTREQAPGSLSSLHPSYLCVCQKVRWINVIHKTILFSAEFSAVNIYWRCLKERLALLLPSLALERPDRGATQSSLVRHDFELVWLWLSAASRAIPSPSCCCYQKAESGIALAADFRLITARWQMVQVIESSFMFCFAQLCYQPAVGSGFVIIRLLQSP